MGLSALSTDARRMLAELAQHSKISESAYLERCIRGRYKAFTSLQSWRANHPNAGWGRTSEYNIWRGIMRRCFDPKCPAYPNYGGRGITVSPQLRTFQGFLSAVGPRPKGMTLDRREVDGNYEPSNLRWASHAQQANNTRANDRITHGGKTLSLSQWAAELGVSQGCLWGRIYKHGWPIKKALSVPPMPLHARGSRLTEKQVLKIRESAETQTVLAARYRVSQSTIGRIKNRQRWAHL